ncbi:MAG TPA: DmsC/YnfH family molybdoenzyme membrane anchor subunit, partial [Chloroflexota bacterium]
MNFREWALPVYTIMVQMATGALLTLWILRAIGKLKVGAEEVDRIVARPVAAILLTIVGALMGSHLHLSRPFLSFLALGNLGSSWLSREVLFTTILFVSVAGLTFMEWYVPGHERLKTGLGWFAIASGAVSIFCMAAIYLLPIQPAWNTPFTVISFYATALLLGILETAVLLILDLRF